MSSSSSPQSAAPARRGFMLVLSSPSGAGKTTLSRKLLAHDSNLHLSVSVTTRQPRTGEIESGDYHFRSVRDFESLRDTNGLLEWAEVHGNYYGTPRADVMERLARGQDLLFDIDWQGAQQLAAQAEADTVRVFILPPSARALEERLVTRAQDGPEVIARRLAGAATEITHWAEYDYVIVNHEVEASFAALVAIIGAERARRSRQLHLDGLARDLIQGLKARKAPR